MMTGTCPPPARRSASCRALSSFRSVWGALGSASAAADGSSVAITTARARVRRASRIVASSTATSGPPEARGQSTLANFLTGTNLRRQEGLRPARTCVLHQRRNAAQMPTRVTPGPLRLVAYEAYEALYWIHAARAGTERIALDVDQCRAPRLHVQTPKYGAIITPRANTAARFDRSPAHRLRPRLRLAFGLSASEGRRRTDAAGRTPSRARASGGPRSILCDLSQREAAHGRTSVGPGGCRPSRGGRRGVGEGASQASRAGDATGRCPASG